MTMMKIMPPAVIRSTTKHHPAQTFTLDPPAPLRHADPGPVIRPRGVQPDPVGAGGTPGPTIQRQQSTPASAHAAGHSTAVVQRLTDDDMARFFARDRRSRMGELKGLRDTGATAEGAFGLMRSRFDLAGVDDDHRAAVEHAFSSETGSASHNARTMSVANDLLGRMFRNAGRARADNEWRDAFNRSGPAGSQQMRPLQDPSRATGAESARLRVGVSRGTAPHYDPEANAVSLMNPNELDQTAHEVQHAYDHIRGDLDLHEPTHRIASELNAFTQQHAVSHELNRAPPRNFEGRTPVEMARTYEGKTAKGYEGNLESSMDAVRQWRRRRPRGS